ncbi:hypothetical protein [Acidocella sp.]|jgi:hypothetical protein|uniref:hypothetical protein n=1 Tax=Acidocella sp. TaxID=50710 RepID=UPI002F3EB90D
MRRIVLMLTSLSLAGCGYGALRQAHEAQISMIGMSRADLLSCAGPPAKSTTLSPVAHVDTYTYSPSNNNGFTLSLPLSMGDVAIGGSGTGCMAYVRVINGKVAEVHHTGADDLTVGEDGVCNPIFRGCMRQPKPKMQPVTGENDSHSSAFTPPPVPRQPRAAEEIETTTTSAAASAKK